MTGELAWRWLLDHADRRPDAPCLGEAGDGGARWSSYAEVAGRLRRVAAGLHALGVRPGELVLLALPNLPATVVASYAAQLLGAAAVELSRERSAEALAELAGRTGARVAVVLGRDAALWAKVPQVERLVVVHPTAPPERLTALLGGRGAAWLRDDGEWEGPSGPPPGEAADPTGTALVVFTSGSTGAPRGVIQTHRNIAANTRAIVEYLGLTAADRVLSVLPLFYCYGKSLLQTHLHVGGSILFDGRFLYPRVVLEAAGAEGCTGFAGVPTTFELIRRQVDVGALALRSLRYVTQAGGAMRADTIAWARQAFAPARLYVMYGQTEATARLSYLPPERAADKAGSIGRGISGVTLAVVDDGGRELPPGAEGHLVARGDSVTPGYFGEPEATSEILHDGWLWTGDLARRDEDGFITITGRSKELLKLGGHRVSPVEIEAVLERHESVAEAAVVGAPDEVGGETAHAFVVARPGAAPTEAELQRHCRGLLPAWCVPARVSVVDALPRTTTGKLWRAALTQRGTP